MEGREGGTGARRTPGRVLPSILGAQSLYYQRVNSRWVDISRNVNIIGVQESGLQGIMRIGEGEGREGETITIRRCFAGYGYHCDGGWACVTLFGAEMHQMHRRSIASLISRSSGSSCFD